MPVTMYRTHDGRIRGESTGGVPTTYLTDALGSVTATVDAGGSVVNTYRHKPYGERLARTGAGADPMYEWTGDTGSRRTGGAESFYAADPLGSVAQARDASGAKVYEARYWAYGEAKAETGASPGPWGFAGLLGYLRDLANLLYVRARHYRPGLARWQTVDPLWPGESAYGYAVQSPASWVDRDGQVPERKGGGSIFVPPANEPCTFSFGTQVGLRCAGAGDCVENTDEYGTSFLRTGNKLDRCASCVSAAICEAIAAGNVGGPLTGGGGAIIGPALAAATACQNNCMIEIWREKSTPLWQLAIKVCRTSGQTSRACCVASVNAEQDGYDRCAPKCFPPLGLIPKPIRILFALDVLHCCG